MKATHINMLHEVWNWNHCNENAMNHSGLLFFIQKCLPTSISGIIEAMLHVTIAFLNISIAALAGTLYTERPLDLATIHF